MCRSITSQFFHIEKSGLKNQNPKFIGMWLTTLLTGYDHICTYPEWKHVIDFWTENVFQFLIEEVHFIFWLAENMYFVFKVKECISFLDENLFFSRL